MVFGRSCVLLATQVALVLLPLDLSKGSVTNHVQFNRDVRPILSENCYACHGPDKNQRKPSKRPLRLDVREVALERGAIVPGKPADSKLVQHIFSDDPDEIMPPPKTQKSLTPAQKELLKQWVAEGAQYEAHWAYLPLGRPPVPQARNAHWVRNPIDAFILHALETKEIAPSPEADRRTLLRRLSLDLIGLPPTPEEVKAFLSDTTPNAYERQADRLLRSPHFGERMAVPWLDVVRFADTVGYHGDQNQNIFPYRDYVIDAFNQNKPFDEFTIEQLAGDLLPSPSIEARVATGFNRLNMLTREGGAQPKEYLAKYAADRVRTVSMTWLGSTMGCAECHDHKFDPFSTKDFYCMEAFFADLKQWGVYADYNYTPEPELKGVDNDYPFPPEIEVDSAYLHRRLARLHAQADAIYARSAENLKSDKQRSREFAAWRKSSRGFLKQWPDGWVTPRPEVTLVAKDINETAKTEFTVQADGIVALNGQSKETVRLSLSLSNIWVAALRLEIVPQEEVGEKPTGRKKAKGVSIALTASLKSKDADQETKLAFYDAEADQKEERYAGGRPILGVKDAWKISTEHEKQTAIWLLDKPFQAKAGDTLVVSLGKGTVASARVSVSPFAGEEPLESGASKALRRAIEDWASSGAAGRALAARAFLLSTHCDSASVDDARKILKEIRVCRYGRTTTMVSVAREPTVTRVLPRGNWQDETGEIVQPSAPHFLPQIPNPEGRRLTRLDLARWLVSPENPLTARAVVNRFWKQFFGTGLSAVLDDLGVQGDWPLNPELLDWLACEFVNPSSSRREEAENSRSDVRARPSGQNQSLLTSAATNRHPWNVKHVIKLMVMSSVYRQNSNQRPALKELDPNNRLLAAQTPRRLAAEFVRDNALYIASLLNEDIGGPSAHPYQPPGYYANLQFPDRDYYPDKDERQYRRGIYTHWQRTFLHPMLANFDAPSREECTANRVVSNTPQQALTLLNDPTFTEAARAFAARLLARAGQSDEQRLDAAFERALARPARQREKASLLKFLADQREHYRQDEDEAEKLIKVGLAPAEKKADKSELAAWTQVCRVILNLQETLTRY